MRPITLLPPAGLVWVGVTVLTRTVVNRGAAICEALIVCVTLTAPDRDGAHSAPAELLGAHDAEAAAEQAIVKAAVLLVLCVGPNGLKPQVEAARSAHAQASYSSGLGRSRAARKSKWQLLDQLMRKHHALAASEDLEPQEGARGSCSINS